MNLESGYNVAGGEICSSKSADVPRWGMFAVAGLVLLLSIPILWSSIPLLFGKRTGDFSGGVAGSLIGLILAGGGIIVIAATRRSSRRFQIRFHVDGVFAGTGDAPEYFPYKSLQSISIEISEPSATSKTISIARGALSLAAGNAAGVGFASGSLKSRGRVEFCTTDGRKFSSIAFSVRDLEEVAAAVESVRGEAIVSRVSV